MVTNSGLCRGTLKVRLRYLHYMEEERDYFNVERAMLGRTSRARECHAGRMERIQLADGWELTKDQKLQHFMVYRRDIDNNSHKRLSHPSR